MAGDSSLRHVEKRIQEATHTEDLTRLYARIHPHEDIHIFMSIYDKHLLVSAALMRRVAVFLFLYCFELNGLRFWTIGETKPAI